MEQEGFKSMGKNVLISKNCTIIGVQNISIGNNVQIDGYSTLIANKNGYIHLGSFIHIGSYSLLSGGAGVVMEDFSGLAQSVHIYSKTDDFSGNYLTNPTIPSKFLGIKSGKVVLCEHVIIGSNSVILPNITIGRGSSIGALSLVNKSLTEWGMYFGTPVRKIGDRSKNLLKLKEIMLNEISEKFG